MSFCVHGGTGVDSVATSTAQATLVRLDVIGAHDGNPVVACLRPAPVAGLVALAAGHHR